MNHILNNIIFKATANNTLILKPDFSIVITEIIIPVIKINGEKINVSRMSLSTAIKELILLLIKETIIRQINTIVHM